MNFSAAVPVRVPTTGICMAIWIAISVAAATSPADAGFLYVPPSPPAETTAATGEEGGQPASRQRPMHTAADPASGREHGVGGTQPKRTDGIDRQYRGAPRRVAAPRRVSAPWSADAEPLQKSGSAGPWQVRAGEMLREALGRWGGRAGIEVLFLTDRRYRLHEGRAFEGSFDEAAMDLLAALSHLPHPPVGETRPDGRTLAVMHEAGRARAPGDGR